MAKTDRTAIRFNAGTLARLEALRPYISTASRDATQADVHRAALVFGLDGLEQAYGVKPPVSMADPMRAEPAQKGKARK